MNTSADDEAQPITFDALPEELLREYISNATGALQPKKPMRRGAPSADVKVESEAHGKAGRVSRKAGRSSKAPRKKAEGRSMPSGAEDGEHAPERAIQHDELRQRL